MKYKLWISPEGEEKFKEVEIGRQLKTHVVSAWGCFAEPKNSDKFCINFGRKDNEDAGFSVSCSLSDAYELMSTIKQALEREQDNAA